MPLPSGAELIGRLIVLILALPVHELMHAWVAYRLGDRTAYDYGRVSLNPLDHLDPIGTFLILFVGFGWAKPVPVNPYQLRYASNARRGMALVSIAGPLSNLLLAAAAAFFWRLGLRPPVGFIQGVYIDFISINIILALFNMIPLAPLDGSKVLMGIVPLEWTAPLASLERYGTMILMLVIFIPYVLPQFSPLDWFIWLPASWLFRFLLGI
jgi:Zn-dependent protease